MYELVKDIGLGADTTCALSKFIEKRNLDINFGYKQRQDGYKKRVRTLALEDMKIIIARIEQGIRDRERFTIFANSGYMSMYKILKAFVQKIEQNTQKP